jgi:hypothetical protein
VAGIARHARSVALAKGVWRRLRGRRLLAAAAVAAAIIAIGVPVASAEAGSFMDTAPPGVFTAISSGIGGPLCMDDWNNSSADYNPVVINNCDGAASQQWYVVQEGSLIMINGLCLDVNGGGTTDGTPVDIYLCNGTAAQVWIPQADHTLYNPVSNKCLDDTNWSATPGTQLQIWDCTGAANQQWFGQRQLAS